MKFKLSFSLDVDTEQSPWKTEGLRIGLFGGSGSGKSNTAALFAEQFLSQGGTVVVFEPRAEYHTLKEKWDVVVCGGPYAKDIDFVPSSPATYAKAVVDQGVSIIFYTTDVEDETKLIEFISRFLYYLLKYNEIQKRPIMLLVEETQEYAPSSTKGRVSPPWVFSRMIKALKTASIDARKLNIVPIAISPRPQETNFTIRQVCNLTFYGKFSPQDAEYVDRECLKHYKTSFYRGKDLITLETGQFAVIASGKSLPLETITEPRLTSHGAVTPKLTYVAPRKDQTKKAVENLTKTIMEALEKERLEQSEVEKLKKEVQKLDIELANKSLEIERLKQTAETLGKIRIETPAQPQPSLDYEGVLDEVRHVLPECIEDLQYLLRFIGSGAISVKKLEPKSDLYAVWEPKMPSLCAKRMFKFLLDTRGAKYTKGQLAVQLGYSQSGTFNGAIAFLRQNNLINYEGRFLWVE